MKTQYLILTLGALVLTAIPFNTTAAALLSPRATGNQIKTVASTANDPDLGAVDQRLATTPRVKGNHTATVADAAKETNPAMACARNMTASPKAVQACAADPAAAMPCCRTSMAVAK